MKKLTRFQVRLQNKVRLYNILHSPLQFAPCCPYCSNPNRLRTSTNDCPPMNKRLRIFLKWDNKNQYWEYSFQIFGSRIEISTEVCDKYFQKTK